MSNHKEEKNEQISSCLEYCRNFFLKEIPANNDKNEAINCVHCKTQKSTIAQLRFISLKKFCSENCSVINI